MCVEGRSPFKIQEAKALFFIRTLRARFPFFSAEVVNSFKEEEDVFNALRASCHVPSCGCNMSRCFSAGESWAEVFTGHGSQSC